MKPRVKIFSFFYNEAFLLPFFLSHYRWADCLHAVVSRSLDQTREILEAARRASPGRIVIEDFEFPAGMDDFIKAGHLNELIAGSHHGYDWLMALDADEFIWPGAGDPTASVHEFLAATDRADTVMMARMWNVFRHETDTDLDATREPVVWQRRHGITDRNGGENAQYQKPVIIRAGHGFSFVPGNHAIHPNPALRFSARHFDGAHWQNADPCFAVQRRIRDRRDRQSQVNLQYGLGSQHHHVTETDARALCAAHRNDPRVF